LEAAQLEALADLAETGDGTLRLTPWRTLLLPGVIAVPEGLIADPADPRLRIRACTGAPGCASGFIDTRAAAARAATRGIPGLLHVSGCGKGCAHPGPAPRLLLGTALGHAVARDARAADPPGLDGLTLDAALEALA
jgi:precorrin-3B synthase